MNSYTCHWDWANFEKGIVGKYKGIDLPFCLFMLTGSKSTIDVLFVNYDQLKEGSMLRLL